MKTERSVAWTWKFDEDVLGRSLLRLAAVDRSPLTLFCSSAQRRPEVYSSMSCVIEYFLIFTKGAEDSDA